MSEHRKGSVGVLNVGAGDTKFIFDSSDPAECIRAARIVTDMLRRGYALLIEVPGKKGAKPTYQRVHAFREDTASYIIADLDPVQAAEADKVESNAQGQSGEEAETGTATEPTAETPRLKSAIGFQNGSRAAPRRSPSSFSWCPAPGSTSRTPPTM